MPKESCNGTLRALIAIVSIYKFDALKVFSLECLFQIELYAKFSELWIESIFLCGRDSFIVCVVDQL